MHLWQSSLVGEEHIKALGGGCFGAFYCFLMPPRSVHFNKHQQQQQQPMAKHISIRSIITELTPRSELLSDPIARGEDLSV